MGQTDIKTCVWYTDADGARFRQGDEVFYEHRGKLYRCTVLLLYETDNVPMVALGTKAGAIFAVATKVKVWPNGR